jgi:hypothetical protein
MARKREGCGVGLLLLLLLRRVLCAANLVLCRKDNKNDGR